MGAQSVDLGSAAAQNVLAAFAELARGVRYKLATDAESVESVEVGERFLEIVERYESLAPQRYDEMYDALHRSGRNA